MNNKKAEEDAWSLIKSLIVAALLVGIVAFIVIKSIGTSTTSIFEPLKKMLGFETKAEASTTSTQDCTIKKYYWSKDKVTILEKVGIVIEGNGNCEGKSVNIKVFKDISFEFDAGYEPINAFFKNGVIKVGWPTYDKGKFYFTLKFGNYISQESKRLEIV